MYNISSLDNNVVSEKDLMTQKYIRKDNLQTAFSKNISLQFTGSFLQYTWSFPQIGSISLILIDTVGKKSFPQKGKEERKGYKSDKECGLLLVKKWKNLIENQRCNHLKPWCCNYSHGGEGHKIAQHCWGSMPACVKTQTHTKNI